MRRLGSHSVHLSVYEQSALQPSRSQGMSTVELASIKFLIVYTRPRAFAVRRPQQAPSRGYTLLAQKSGHSPQDCWNLAQWNPSRVDYISVSCIYGFYTTRICISNYINNVHFIEYSSMPRRARLHSQQGSTTTTTVLQSLATSA